MMTTSVDQHSLDLEFNQHSFFQDDLDYLEHCFSKVPDTQRADHFSAEAGYSPVYQVMMNACHLMAIVLALFGCLLVVHTDYRLY